MKPSAWSTGLPQTATPASTRLRWPWVLLSALLLGACGAGFWFYQGRGESPASLPFELPIRKHTPIEWKLVLDPEQPTTVVVQDAPEQMVRQIYRHLGEGERVQALAVAEHLANRYPNFQLGQLLYADLLNISLSQPLAEIDDNEETVPSAQRRLKELVLESTRRLLHPPLANLKGKLPAGLVYLDPVQHPYVAAVDTSRSRLYWFANRAEAASVPKLELVMDSYISVGAQGVGKQSEGDGRTPLGLYFIQKHLADASLPDLFGKGALTLNYPNAIDVMHKRSGSGIWLHGTPSSQYSRAPEATDGCIVLPNPEMGSLLRLGNLRQTPVLISRELEWQEAGKQPSQERIKLMAKLQSWNQARLQDNDTALRNHYSARFERDGLGLDAWWAKLRLRMPARQWVKPLEMTSAVVWKDQEELLAVTWLDPNRSTPTRKEYLRTYWAREGGDWKILFEGPA